MFRSPLFPLFLTVFVDVLGLTIIYPLLPYYAEHFGATPLQVGILTATYAACQLFSGPVLGHISDRVGRKPTLLASQIGTLLGFATLGFANSLWMLFLGRIIDGVTAGNLSIAQAYITDVTKPENRTRAFGLIGVAFGMGFLIGPASSGLLAQRYGFSAPVFAAAGLSALSVVLTATLLPEVPRAADAAPGAGRSLQFGRFFRRPAVRRRLLQFFAYILSFSSLIGGTALFLERRFHYNVEQTGYVFAFSGLIGAIIQGGLIGRLVRKLGEARLAALGLAAMVVAHAALGFSTTLGFLLVVVAISNFGVAVVRPSLTTLITRGVDTGEQGAALGTSQSLASVGQIIGPILAGFLIQRDQLVLYGVCSAAFALVGVLLQIGAPAEVDEPAPT
jgi:MFS transporter, DHA1 family, tetracycline resistance protein